MDVDSESPRLDLSVSPLKSVEGYILIITNLHEEANEDELADLFTEFGMVRTIHLNIDRRTGYAKGYALIEYATIEEAQQALEEGNGLEYLDMKLHVDWAFVSSKNTPRRKTLSERISRRRSRSRSKSPSRR